MKNKNNNSKQKEKNQNRNCPSAKEVNEKENWYVIKINEEGNRIAISSPIFIKK